VPRALSTVLVALALLVAACGSDDPKAAPSPPPPAADAALPAVSGAPGAAPTLGKPAGAAPAKLTVKVVNEGDGPATVKGDLVVMNYVGRVWAADKPFGTSYGQVPVAITVGSGQTFPGLDSGLVGKKVGSRVLLALPPDQAFGAQGNPQIGVKPTDTVLFLVDLVARYAGKDSAKGTAQPAKPGLPVVTGEPGQKPKITLPTSAAPTKLVKQTLVEGTGPGRPEG
jgi:peptidylprolyl isomerase